jgi:O-antigen/teichoic acid export membrane protein
VLQVFNRFRVQSILSTAGTVALLASVSAAYFAGASLPGMLAATLAGNLAAGFPLTIVALATASRRLGSDWWRVPLGSIRGRWAAPFRFALSTNASATLSLVTRDADPLLIGLFRSTTEVGYYRLGVAAASYALMPVSQLAQAFYPEIARKAARAEWGEFRRLLRQGSGVAAAYVLPLAVTLVFAADWLIGTVYGAEFRPAASVLLVVFIGMGFSHLLFWNRPALLAVGRADYPLKINLLVAVVKVPGIFLLIAPYGYIGTAALLTLLYLLGVGLSVVKLQAELRRRESVAPAET